MMSDRILANSGGVGQIFGRPDVEVAVVLPRGSSGRARRACRQWAVLEGSRCLSSEPEQASSRPHSGHRPLRRDTVSQRFKGTLHLSHTCFYLRMFMQVAPLLKDLAAVCP